MIFVVICGLTIFAIHISNKASKKAIERFENEEPAKEECPIQAERTPDGKIQVQPGNTLYGSMQEYLDYLNGLYAKGSMCLPPKVTNNASPIPGVLGGLGTNTESPDSVKMQGGDRTVLDFSPAEQGTYAKTPIDKLDDYEYTRVFQSENNLRNALTEETKSDLMNKHTLDWANLPFNAEKRAKKEDEFVAGRKDTAYQDPETGAFFKNVEGNNVEPPDMDAAKQREDNVLSAYQPTDISTHTVGNEMLTVAQIVNAAYKNDPNWEPVIRKTSDYQWEVTELRPKEKKEKYEDEKSKDLAFAQSRGETLPPPSISIDDRMRNDPYFDKSGVGDRDNGKFWKYDDFTKWTPGLERMFAPTLTNKEWD